MHHLLVHPALELVTLAFLGANPKRLAAAQQEHVRAKTRSSCCGCSRPTSGRAPLAQPLVPIIGGTRSRSVACELGVCGCCACQVADTVVPSGAPAHTNSHACAVGADVESNGGTDFYTQWLGHGCPGKSLRQACDAAVVRGEPPARVAQQFVARRLQSYRDSSSDSDDAASDSELIAGGPSERSRRGGGWCLGGDKKKGARCARGACIAVAGVVVLAVALAVAAAVWGWPCCSSEPTLGGECDSSVDTDGDGTPDCTDGCPADADKTSPGVCGRCNCPPEPADVAIGVADFLFLCEPSGAHTTDEGWLSITPPHTGACNAKHHISGKQELTTLVPLDARGGLAVDWSTNGGGAYSCCYSCGVYRTYDAFGQLEPTRGYTTNGSPGVHVMHSFGAVSTHSSSGAYHVVPDDAALCWLLLPVSATHYQASFFVASCDEALAGGVGARETTERAFFADSAVAPTVDGDMAVSGFFYFSFGDMRSRSGHATLRRVRINVVPRVR